MFFSYYCVHRMQQKKECSIFKIEHIHNQHNRNENFIFQLIIDYETCENQCSKSLHVTFVLAPYVGL